MAQGKGEDDAQVKEAKAAMLRADWAVKEARLRADLAVKEIKYEICAAEVKTLMAQGKGEDDAQVKEAKAARDDAREERNKASARLDGFTTSKGAQQGLSADELHQIAIKLCGPSLLMSFPVCRTFADASSTRCLLRCPCRRMICGMP